MGLKFIFTVFILFLVFSVNISAEITGETVTGETVTGEITQQSLGISVDLIAPLPSLTLIRPENETYIDNQTILLNYSATFATSVWYNLDNGGNTTLTGNTQLSTSEGSHTLYLYANNSNGTVTQNVSFFVNSSIFRILYDEYKGKGSTTNLSLYSYEDLQNLGNLTLENSNFEKIVFNQTINMTEDADFSDNLLDLDSYVNISSNRIEIDSTFLPNFNKIATLSLYDLSFSDPRILRDGVVCPPSICTEISYFGGTLLFNVSGFTIYSAEETPVEEAPPVTTGGGGGGSSIPPELIQDFVIDTDILNIKMVVGEIKIREIKIKKVKIVEEVRINAKLQGDDEIYELVVLDKDSLILNSSLDEEIIKVKIIAPNEAGIYLGKIIIESRDIKKEVLIAINAQSKESLFDMSVIIPKPKLYPGDNVRAQIDIIPIGEKGVDVNLKYMIKDFKGKIHYEENETLYIWEQESFEKEFETDKLAVGDYILGAEIIYIRGFATASDQFKIVEYENPILALKRYLKPQVFLVIIGIMSVIVLVMIIRNIRKYRKITTYKKLKNKYK